MTTLTSPISTDAGGAWPSRVSRPATRGASRDRRGFTLLEVLVVVAIAGVVAALVMPQIRAGSRQSAVRRSVRAFLSAAREASAIAVTTRRPTALVVWPEEGAFGVEGGHGRHQLPEFAEFGEITGGREAEADKEIYFDFYPTGSSAGGSVAIEFTPDDRRQAYILVLDPLIARVHIKEDS